MSDPLDWPKFWEQDHSDVDWLIPDYLARGRGHALFAKQKSGKSLFHLCQIAELITSNPDVVCMYFDYEMTEADVYERLSDMGYGPDTDFSRLLYYLLPNLDPLDTQVGGRSLLALVDQVRAAHPGKHVVVSIDTIGRAVMGEENSADTIRDFYRWTGIGLKQRGCTWVRIDHAGKDPERDQRGSSAKGDDVDVVWKIEPAESGLVLRRVVARMNWVPAKVAFQLLDGPLRFKAAAATWPVGTLELAGVLDDLGVPLQAGVRVARKALQDASRTATQSVLAAAIRYRKRYEAPAVTLSAVTAVTPIHAVRNTLSA